MLVVRHGVNELGIVAHKTSTVPTHKIVSLLLRSAGRYNTMGGDISHFMLYQQLWGCPSNGALLGFEPIPRQWRKLVDEVTKTLATSQRGETSADGNSHSTWSSDHRRCTLLSAKAVSDHIGRLPLINMPYAGDNSAQRRTWIEPTWRKE